MHRAKDKQVEGVWNDRRLHVDDGERTKRKRNLRPRPHPDFTEREKVKMKRSRILLLLFCFLSGKTLFSFLTSELLWRVERVPGRGHHHAAVVHETGKEKRKRGNKK